MVNPTKVIDDKFFEDRSVVDPVTECVEWTRRVSVNGYGTLKYKQKQYMAHRFMWEFKFGPIPDGKIICHKCDNRKCINPDHLFIGTTQDNVDDKMAKGRFVPCPGERSGTSKLTEAQIVAIRADTRPQYVIAKEYGVCRSNISVIKRGSSWGHIPVVEDKRMSVKEFADQFGVPYDKFRHQLLRQKRGFRQSLAFFCVSL
jgi:hypothetical protein